MLRLAGITVAAALSYTLIGLTVSSPPPQNTTETAGEFAACVIQGWCGRLGGQNIVYVNTHETRSMRITIRLVHSKVGEKTFTETEIVDLEPGEEKASGLCTRSDSGGHLACSIVGARFLNVAVIKPPTPLFDRGPLYSIAPAAGSFDDQSVVGANFTTVD